MESKSPKLRRRSGELTLPAPAPAPAEAKPAAESGRRQSITFKHRSLTGGEAEAEEWSYEHAQLLYLVSLYAQPALAASDKEGWIRQIPLFALMFEGIVAGVLPYDYAPCSMLITAEGASKRLWMNVTQEGKAAVDDLREKKLINGLKLSAKDFSPVTAYQVSLKGLAFLAIMPQSLKDAVTGFLTPPNCPPATDGSPPPLLSVSFDGQNFMLDEPVSGFRRKSNVTQTEDVSYVSSPYLPACLRSSDGLVPEFSSNAHRAHECAVGGSTIAEEVSESIVLGGVHAMVGEWIPFGSNQIVALNERLGALDRCQGGLFTAMVDSSPTDTKFLVPPGLTQVTILDFDFVRFINFEAEINYPESEGIVQIESLGMHLKVDGTIVYALHVEAILDRPSTEVSLDHLSRLLVDVHKDSSRIMNDLLSQYQRSLLDMLFMGDTARRNKFNVILAAEITPKMQADEYMDKGEYENELKQVLGDLRAVYDVSPDDVLIIGRDGLLASGPNVRDYEPVIVTYLSLLCRDIFIRNYFVRIFVLTDSLKNIRRLIMEYQRDPNNIDLLRGLLNNASRDIVLMKEILQYMIESIDNIEMPTVPEDAPDREAQERLHRMLDVRTMRADVLLRCTDLNKLVDGAHNQLATLQQMTDVINSKQLEDVFKSVESNTKYLVDASAANERSSASLDIMQIILAGSFAFDIVDRISGGTLNVAVPEWVESYIVEGIIAKPGLFWLLNMVWLFLVGLGLKTLKTHLAANAKGALSLRVKVDRPLSVEALEAMLTTKEVKAAESVIEESFDVRKVAWQETDAVAWCGYAPDVEITYDAKHGFLLYAFFQIDTKRTELREEGLMRCFYQMCGEHGIFGEVTADAASAAGAHGEVGDAGGKGKGMSVSGVKFL